MCQLIPQAPARNRCSPRERFPVGSLRLPTSPARREPSPWREGTPRDGGGSRRSRFGRHIADRMRAYAFRWGQTDAANKYRMLQFNMIPHGIARIGATWYGIIIAWCNSLCSQPAALACSRPSCPVRTSGCRFSCTETRSAQSEPMRKRWRAFLL